MRSAIHTNAFASLLLATPLACLAQSTFPPTLDDPYYAAVPPRTGTYFDPEHPGTLMSVDAKPDGAIFVSFSMYDKDGKPTWYFFHDKFEPQFAYALGENGKVNYDAWHVSDGIAYADAVVYRAYGGQCPGCTYTTPKFEIATELGTAKLHWTNTGHVRLTLAGNTSNWTLHPVGSDEIAQTAGAWKLRYWRGSTSWEFNPAVSYPSEEAASAEATVVLEPMGNPGLVPVNPLLGNGPTPGNIVATDWFSLQCIDACDPSFWGQQYPGVPALSGAKWAVWFDRVSGRAGIQQYGQVNGQSVFSYATRAFSLHPYGDRMVARQSQYPNVSLYAIGPRPTQGAVIEMRRLNEAAY